MVIRHFTLLYLLALCLPLIGFGQNTVTPVPAEKTFIEVVGKSYMDIPPDEIYVSLSLNERIENREKISIESQEDSLKRILNKLAIDLSNLTVASEVASYQRTKVFRNGVLISKSYTLKVSSATMLDKVYENFEKMKIGGAFVQRVDHSKMKEFKKENQLNAIKDAREKVDYLLKAIGKQAGKTLQVTEVQENGLVEQMKKQYLIKNKKLEYGADFTTIDLDQMELGFDKIKLESAFYVKYEIINN